jgi:molybdate transport system permease protein
VSAAAVPETGDTTLRHGAGASVFNALAGGALAFEVLFVVAVVAGLILFTDMASLKSVVTSGESLFALRLTLITVTTTTVICMALAIPAAYALSRFRIPCAPLVDTLLDLPIVMPPIAAGLALLVLFGYYLGEPMLKAGIYLPYTQPGLVVAQVFATMTFSVRSAKAAFDAVPPRLPLVAQTLGSSPWSAFRRVVLPAARNGLMAGAVLTWARAMGLFGPVVMFCGATRFRTTVLPTSIYLHNSTGRLEEAAAGTLLMMVVALLVLVTFKRLGGRGYLW